MSSPSEDTIEFDETLAMALAQAADVGDAPSVEIKSLLMARVAEALPPLPEGFVFSIAAEGWQPYPIPGIRMKILSLNRAKDCATILIDAAPGARFPAHHHGGDEECYIIAGDAHSYGRRMGPGDFLHADAGTDHTELYTENGALVLLVVRPEDYIPGYVREEPPTSPTGR